MNQNRQAALIQSPSRSLRLVVDNGGEGVIDDCAAPEGAGRFEEPDLSDGFDIDDLSACLEAVALRQDRAAFKALFGHFAPRIKSYVMRLGCTPQQAEELAQETMIKVWRKADQFDAAKSAPSTWIFRIARNLRIDTFRRENRPELDPNDPSLVPEPERPADTEIERKQSEGQLRTAIESLPQEQKSILHLSFFEDMSHGEIAKHLDLPLGTVKSRLRLALGKLRTNLDDGPEPASNGQSV